MKIQLPQNVKYIIKLLIQNGYEAYAVGGCVRDSILGIKPEDWDITTSAKPHEIKKIFTRTVDTGIEHGTVTVLINKDGYEVTTYRIDGEYEDSRHPNYVEFTSELANDLKRRDFTINAMAYNDKDGLIDLYQGLEDIHKGVIQCVGTPSHRFDEDALRILRAFRFSAQLNFKIEENTLKAACLKKDKLTKISAERIRTELNKILLSSHPEKFFELYHAGITKIILPEFDSMMEGKYPDNEDVSIGMYSIKSLQTMNQLELKEGFHFEEKVKLILRWALFLQEITNHAKDILKRLKFDNETISKTTRLIEWIKEPFILSPAGMRRGVYMIGSDIIELLFIIKRVKVMAWNHPDNKEKLQNLNRAKDIYQQILLDGDCTNLNMLCVNGKDLINIGFKPGKELGDTLKLLLDQVLDNPDLNRKETLLSIARKTKIS